MPFGATASVVAWHRVGDLLLEIARRLLHLPAFRYVDDYFAAERTGLAQHGLGTFVRLVRAVLGSSAVADAKTEFGPELVILGIQVQVPPCGDLAACALLLCVRAGDVRL